MTQNGGFVFVCSDDEFASWIYEAYRPEVKALEEELNGTVLQIYREFEWAHKGDRCCKEYIQTSSILSSH